MAIKRCSKGSIPIVKRFLGENFVRQKWSPKIALIRGNGGLDQSINQSINQSERIKVTKVTNVTARPLLDIRFCVRDPEKAHPWAEPCVLAYFALKSVQGPWL